MKAANFNPRMKLATIVRPHKRGAAAVEMAFVLPIFVLVVLGMIEVGRGLMVAELVEDAAREATRAAILNGSTNSSVTNTATTVLQNSGGIAPGNVSVSISVAGVGNGSVATAQPRDMIAVTVSVPYAATSWLPPHYLAGKNLTSTCTMWHE